MVFRFFIAVFMTALLGITAWVGYMHTNSKYPGGNSPALVIYEKDHGTPKLGGPFQLVDHEGKIRTQADFKGKILLIYFGYSFCPDICPTALYNISQALESLGKYAKEFQPLFITIDPKRDTSHHLARYRENYHPAFVMLTGTTQQIQEAMKAYKVHGAKVKPDGTTTEYLMDHSSIIYVMDRQGRFIAHFNHQTPLRTLVESLMTILKE